MGGMIIVSNTTPLGGRSRKRELGLVRRHESSSKSVCLRWWRTVADTCIIRRR
jgi:hypothetical protein